MKRVAGGLSRLRCFQQQLYGFHHQRIKAPVFAGSLSNSLHWLCPVLRGRAYDIALAQLFGLRRPLSRIWLPTSFHPQGSACHATARQSVGQCCALP